MPKTFTPTAAAQMRIVLVSASLLACAMLPILSAGCDNQIKQPAKRPVNPLSAASVPPEVQGTIAQHAVLRGNTAIPVEGFCLAVGLGRNGSSEVPAFLEKYLIEYLKKQNMGSKIQGSTALTPMMMIRDVDTAVVQVRGVIPPGARKGSRFDLAIVALPGTQTRSLDGGTLMPTELFLYRQGAPSIGVGSEALAMGGGEIFINPFLDSSKDSDRLKLRSGYVIGGGKVLQARPLRLELYEPNWARCSQLVRRINEAFSPNKPIAKGKNMGIDLMVPPGYENDPDRFTQLVMHLPLTAGGSENDAHALRIAKMMELPDSRHEDLALVWEAMGRNVQSAYRSCYNSANPEAAYFAARTGMRLGDDLATDIVIKFARGGNDRLQLFAIAELGMHRRIARASEVLRDLIDSDNQRVRQVAYEALLRRDDKSITTITVHDRFKVDLLASTKPGCIYAAQSHEQRLAIFGSDIVVAKPVFYCSPDETVTVNAQEADEKLMVSRKLLRTGQSSPPFSVGFDVIDLITVMGRPAVADDDGKIAGLGFTYSQVVSTLQRMCKDGSINAKFVLQPIGEVETMAGSAAGTSRTDMAEKTPATTQSTKD
jgi:hypothetical protein